MDALLTTFPISMQYTSDVNYYHFSVSVSIIFANTSCCDHCWTWSDKWKYLSLQWHWTRGRGGLGWAAARLAEYCQPKTTEFCLILWLSRHSRHWLDKAMSLNSEIIINSFLHLDTSSRNIDPFWNKWRCKQPSQFFFHFAFGQGVWDEIVCFAACGNSTTVNTGTPFSFSSLSLPYLISTLTALNVAGDLANDKS